MVRIQRRFRLSADGTAIRSIITTTGSAVGATVVWMALEYYISKKVTVMGHGTGILAGLVFITPMAAYVSVSTSIAVGIVGGLISYALYWIIHNKLSFDDALDVFAVHGVGGIFGSVITAFMVQERYGAAADGLLFGGNADILIGNGVAMAVCFVFGFAVTYALIFICNKIIPGKMTEEEEVIGQDALEHSETAYN